jgi:dienelactone hydrolase
MHPFRKMTEFYVTARDREGRRSYGLILCLLLFSACINGAANFAAPTSAANGIIEQMRSTMLKPEGPGPFPAVVLLHDCSGLGPRSSGAPMRWARKLVEKGYVIVLPDSFTVRGYGGGVCTNPSPSRNEVAPARRVPDAYVALAYLRTLPYVDGSRIGIMGGSHGGATTLASIAAPERTQEPLAQEKRGGFSAAIALYPGCAPYLEGWRTATRAGGSGSITHYVSVYKPVAPLLILIGANDDWTPAEPCRRLTESARQAGYPVSIKIYPGAHHSFDSNRPVNYNPDRVNGNSPTGRGATTGGDPDAWEDSIREVIAFFGEQLKNSAK